MQMLTQQEALSIIGHDICIYFDLPLEPRVITKPEVGGGSVHQ